MDKTNMIGYSIMNKTLFDSNLYNDRQQLSIDQRMEAKVNEEDLKFDDDYYLDNLYGSDRGHIYNITKQQPTHILKYKELCANIDVIKKVITQDPLLSKDELSLYYMEQALIDILFAYAYEIRSMSREIGETLSLNTVIELSTFLSWLNVYQETTNLRTVVISCIRRSLCFPLHRNWDLALAALEDVRKIISRGPGEVALHLAKVSALLVGADGDQLSELKNDLSLRDCRILESVYVAPLLDFLSADGAEMEGVGDLADSFCQSLVQKLSEVDVKKSDVGLDLELLEMCARSLMRDEVAHDVSSSDGDSSHGASDQLSNVMRDLSDLNIRPVLDGHCDTASVSQQTLEAADVYATPDLESMRAKVQNLKTL